MVLIIEKNNKLKVNKKLEHPETREKNQKIVQKREIKDNLKVGS